MPVRLVQKAVAASEPADKGCTKPKFQSGTLGSATNAIPARQRRVASLNSCNRFAVPELCQNSIYSYD
jgi:hypothetical protein